MWLTFYSTDNSLKKYFNRLQGLHDMGCLFSLYFYIMPSRMKPNLLFAQKCDRHVWDLFWSSCTAWFSFAEQLWINGKVTIIFQGEVRPSINCALVFQVFSWSPWVRLTFFTSSHVLSPTEMGSRSSEVLETVFPWSIMVLMINLLFMWA